jgi:YVTN family beta-propeller protein
MGCVVVRGAEPGDASGHANDKLWNGWGMTPSGQIVPLSNLANLVPGAAAPASPMSSDLPLRLVVSLDGKFLLAACGGYNHTGVAVLSLAERRVTRFYPLPEVFNGLAFSNNGQRVFVCGGDSGVLHVFKYEKGELTAGEPVKPDSQAQDVFLAGIAVHPASGKLYVCNEAAHEVWVVDPDSLLCEASIHVEMYPHSCAFGGDRRHLYVSNWGSRSVSVIDTQKGRKVRDIGVGIRPNEMALAADGRLFVVCAGDNTVHVIQTRTLQAAQSDASPEKRLPEETREILSTSLYPASPEGSTPDAVAVSPDGKTLYVANADNNNVMVVDIRDPRESRIAGFIPVGWYPTALAVTPDNGTLLVANGKGVQSRPSAVSGKASETHRGRGVPFLHPGRLLEGSVAFIPRPDDAALARYWVQAAKNSPYTPNTLREAVVASHSCIPDQVGAECPIKYVLYVIKENRTYDQVLGDFTNAQGRPAGNSDPKLVMYGENVTPNQHQLARDYVLLDNFYCNGEVSVDGHDWCDAAMVTDFKQRSWILSYSQHGKLPGNDELRVPAAGYLWDHCRRHGLSFKCYGEGAGRVPAANRGTWSGKRDTERADGWIADLHAAETRGMLPRFAVMSLGENHTFGTAPGAFTPDACVGSNDLALAKIVEAASRSRFWKEMAIFVVEDDPQNGPDHVDCHRTVALVVSPWVRRGEVDSTFYTQVSMVRTIELILGLPPMTQYDAAAMPMFACFQNRPEAVVYHPLQPKVDLKAVNKPNAFGAKISAQMDFDDYDRAPEDQLNRILWAVAKGADVPYPPTVRRALRTRP